MSSFIFKWQVVKRSAFFAIGRLQPFSEGVHGLTGSHFA